MLLGGGHAHVGVLRRFARRALPAQLTLVTPEPVATYSGMLPGVIAGIYALEQAQLSLAPLVRAAGAALHLTQATGIDPVARTVRCADGAVLRYDRLSLDIGASAAAPAGAIAVTPVAGLLPRLAAMERALPAGGHVVVVGAGAGGVELVLALAARLPPGTRLTLLGALLPEQPALRARVAAELTRRHIAHVADRARGVAADVVLLHGAAPLPADAVFWATGAAAPGWLRETGLALDRGFLAVDRHLRVGGGEGAVFAAGDVATLRPRSGVQAVRAGPVLAENLRRSLTDAPLRGFRLRRTALVLLATGDRRAIAARGSLVAAGGWAWWLKDRIDRGYVRG